MRPQLTPALLKTLARAVPRRAQMVWVAIWAHAAVDTGRAWPSARTIAKILGVRREHVAHDIQALERAGWLGIEHRAGTSNVYYVKAPQEVAPETAHPHALGGAQNGTPPPDRVAPETAHLPQERCAATGAAPPKSGAQNGTGGVPPRAHEHSNEHKKRAPAFVRPTVDEVAAYCAERQNQVDPERFVNYYQSNGWKVGRNPMKNWRAAVRTWERNGDRRATGQPSKPREPYVARGKTPEELGLEK